MSAGPLVAQVVGIGLGLLLFAIPAAAKTTVTRDGTTVTIHVPIEVEGLEDPSGVTRVVILSSRKLMDPQLDLETYLRTYAQPAAMRIWNDAFSGVSWGDCVKFKVDLQFIRVKSGQHQAGRHHVKMSGIFNHANWWEATGPDDQVPTRDFPFAYSRDMVGHWGAPDGETVAHEVGHAMGLGDDYFVMSDDNGDRVLTGGKAERELGEADSVMYNHHHAPDSAIVFRILAQMQEAGVLPQCTRDLLTVYVWEGDIKKEFVQQANQDSLHIAGKWNEQFHVIFLQVPASARSSICAQGWHEFGFVQRWFLSTWRSTTPWHRRTPRLCRAGAA